MEHVITLRDVVEFMLIMGGIVAVLIGFVALLYFFAQGWDH